MTLRRLSGPAARVPRLRTLPPIRVFVLFCTLLALLLTSSGCGILWSRRRVPKLPNLPMRSATTEQLKGILNQYAEAIHTLNAKVLLVASTGGAHTGSVTNYHEIQGYLLVRKPGDVRLIGQFSIFGTVFEMATNGTDFELSIPPRGEFFTGQNDFVPPAVHNPLERLRPPIILQSLLINPIEPGQQVVAMNDNADTQAEYTLLVLQPDGAGVEHLVRKVIFSRYDLLPRQAMFYRPDGTVATRAEYGEFLEYGGVSFPSQVLIERPDEEYSIRLLIETAKFNEPLPDSDFVLKQPAGSRLVPLGPAPAAPEERR